MVYVTRKVNLKTPATSLKVIADVFRPPTSEVKFMYKIIKNDEETLLDDVGFEYFNTDGSPDVSTAEDARNFKEYEFTANDLPEFSGFVVKIVGQGTSTSIVPAGNCTKMYGTCIRWVLKSKDNPIFIETKVLMLLVNTDVEQYRLAYGKETTVS